MFLCLVSYCRVTYNTLVHHVVLKCLWHCNLSELFSTNIRRDITTNGMGVPLNVSLEKYWGYFALCLRELA